ncbi:MAG: CHAT domain-containing protein, partial [Cyclobacteriaceae bacterium]|nr:CHAT domain-containing protein [Cyclobacteriaceae bacterium]
LSNFKRQGPEVADAYYYLSRAQGGCARNYAIAMPLMHTSIALKRQLYGEGIEVSLNYSFLGYMFINQSRHDSALYYLNKSLAIQKKHLQPDDPELATTLFYLGRLYENQSELGTALRFLQQSHRIRLAKLPPQHPTISNSLQQLGSLYQKLGNTDRALDYFKKSLDMRIQSLGPNHANVAASYWSIGNLYGNIFNYHQAILYTKQGNAIMYSLYGDKSDILPTYDAYLGKMYGKIGDHASALASFKRAQQNAEKSLGADHPYRAIVYNIIGEYYADGNNSSLAIDYLSKALAIFQKAGGSNAVREADVLAKMGSVNVKTGDSEKGLNQYQHALSVYQSKMSNANPKVASLYLLMGDARVEQQQFDDALALYQKSFASISHNFHDTTSFASNPSIDLLDNKPLALRIAGKKAKTLAQLFEKSNQLVHLQQSLNVYQYATTLAEELSVNFDLESSKVELKKEIASLYDRAMETAHQLYSKTKETKYINDAFVISEKSKASLLLENIRDRGAKALAGVPDSLVQQENDIKIELAYHQSNLLKAKIGKDTAKINLAEKAIFQLQQQFSLLKNNLEKKFPAYFNLKYKPREPSLTSEQNSLPNNNTCLVEFYTAESNIYRFSIYANEVSLEKIKKDDTLNQLIADYQKSISDVDFILNHSAEADLLYTSSAYSLYEILLRPTLDNHTVNNLIIIPDGKLAQVNFGTLLMHRPDGKPDYKTLDYVTKQVRASYAYSASWLSEHAFSRNSSEKKFGGFAPSYHPNQFAEMDTLNHAMAYLVMRSGNLPLPGAAAEVKSISQLMQGDSWTEQEASETNFKTKAGSYGILHLAMHTLLDNENPEYSELLFNHDTDSQNDGYLTVAEIYNLKLNAAMVVLSACSSGFGKIQAGEGPISISRAFSYAGCPSVIMSLWKVPDEVTSTIMTDFYAELKKGKEKDEALRLAQLKFLTETSDPIYHHPYFWAGIVVMGDTNPLSKKFPLWAIYGIAGAVLIALTVIWLRGGRYGNIV